MGIPEHQAASYEAGIREGYSHVFIHTDAANAERAAEFMRERHALRVDIHDVAKPLPYDVTDEDGTRAV